MTDEQIKDHAAQKRALKRYEVTYGPEFVNESEETTQPEVVVAAGFRFERDFIVFFENPNPEWGPYFDVLALRTDHIVRVEQKESA